MKKVIKGFAYCRPASKYESHQPNVIDGFEYAYCYTSTEGWGDGYIHAGTCEMTIELPEGFDPRSGAVDMLEKKRKEIQAEFQARMTEIDRQISQYTAIEFTA